MEQRKTCAGCQHLKKNKDSSISFLVFYCGNTDKGAVIPHRVERNGSEWDCTFWRVPEFCSLPDSEVLKSKNQAPEKDWIHIKEAV